MYLKRFLWGVEGVRLAGGRDEEEPRVGGVCRVDSLRLVGCAKVGSGEKFGGVGCGIVLSNSSERKRVENVRFASSATKSMNMYHAVHREALTPLEMQVSVWSSLLCFRWSCRRAIIVQETEAGLQILPFSIGYEAWKYVSAGDPLILGISVSVPIAIDPLSLAAWTATGSAFSRMPCFLKSLQSLA